MTGSEGLSGFLDYLQKCQEQYNIVRGELEQADNETQDLLHSLELEDNTYYEKARIAKVLGEVRRNRRSAKDSEMILQPLIDWMSIQKNAEAINALKRLLGDMRKLEKKTDSRWYKYRTDIVQVAKETK